MKKRQTSELGFETTKCRLLDRRPAINLIITLKVPQQRIQICKRIDLLVIVIVYAEKLLKVLVGSGYGPVSNSFQFGWVHTHLAMTHYVA